MTEGIMEDTAVDPRGKRRGLTEDGYAVFDKVDEIGRRVVVEATQHDSGRLSDGTTWKLLTEDKE
jgi:hypothetical protein